MRFRSLVALGLLWLSALPSAATVVKPALHLGSRHEWRVVSGDWQVVGGAVKQRERSRLAATILREPAFRGNLRLNVEFNIAPVGNGVRAAAVLFHATGTLTYYWLHLDSRNHNIIFTRSTPTKPWLEIGRTRCPGLTEGAWHALQVVLVHGELTVTLDGQEAYRARDTALTGGRVGLGTSQGQVTFRKLVIEGEVDPMAAPLKDEQPPYQVISRGEASGSYQSFPDACRLKNGDILCVFYAGYGHVSLPTPEWPRGGRVCMVRSRDEGKTWSAPAVLYDGPEDNRDPHIAQLSDGRVVCSFFNYEPEAGKRTQLGCYLVWSEDGGQTFGAPQQVADAAWALSAPVRELPDGTLLLGVYTGDGGFSYGGVVRSTDHGKTWSAPIPIGKEAKLPLDAETDVIRLKDGTLYAALRSSKINMHYATSPDGGLTWSPVKDIGFPGHAPHFTRLSTGAILMTHRVPQTALHVSRDECRTWQGPYVLDSVGGAYPATVELKDGSVLVVYYEEGEGSAVRAQRFRLEAEGIAPLAW